MPCSSMPESSATKSSCNDFSRQFERDRVLDWQSENRSWAMANYDHGAHSDDVRVFDGGEDDEDIEGSRLPLLIVIALLVLAAFGAVVWLAYQRGVAQGHSEVPRVIAAQPGPAKVAPSNAGGTPTPYTGLKIYQQPAPSDEEASNDTATA